MTASASRPRVACGLCGRDVLPAMTWPVWLVPGVKADTVIATGNKLARNLRKLDLCIKCLDVARRLGYEQVPMAEPGRKLQFPAHSEWHFNYEAPPLLVKLHLGIDLGVDEGEPVL